MGEDLFATFHFGNKLGEGCFGPVFEATTELPGKVAVKIFQRWPGESDTQWLSRKLDLLAEGTRLKEAEHANVVQVHQVLHRPSDDAVYLVMEYCANGSLNSEFESGPMKIGKLRSILHDVALGLHAIHARNLLHRDIKPSNILLDKNGRAKLGDFGFVTNDIMFGYASAAGYLDHIAIETYHACTTNIRTDVWALGMTTYRLLHGKVFYDELSDPRTLIPLGGYAENLPWLPHIPDRWRSFVRQLMRDEPERRCQDALRVTNLLARLPTKPEWHCKYSAKEVLWQSQKKGQTIEVVWKKPSPRKNEWSATSLSIGSGRVRHMAGSAGQITQKAAMRELRDFFSIFARAN